MAERRPLTEGLKAIAPSVDAEREKDFVYGNKGTGGAAQKQSSSAQNLSRVPISTRIRADFAVALKRASLERQLHSIEPNTLQDILEQAIEPWLKSNGYIRG
jgi:hypothetical protein